MGPILSPWPKLSGARMGYPYGPHVQAHMGPMWDMYGHVGWVGRFFETRCSVLL